MVGEMMAWWQENHKPFSSFFSKPDLRVDHLVDKAKRGCMVTEEIRSGRMQIGSIKITHSTANISQCATYTYTCPHRPTLVGVRTAVGRNHRRIGGLIRKNGWPLSGG
jgi:hypothetical protein